MLLKHLHLPRVADHGVVGDLLGRLPPLSVDGLVTSPPPAPTITEETCRVLTKCTPPCDGGALAQCLGSLRPRPTASAGF
jgi:hypothetical protein